MKEFKVKNGKKECKEESKEESKKSKEIIERTEFDYALKQFIKDFKDLKINQRFGENYFNHIYNLIPLSYNNGKSKGVCTIIKKEKANKKYNEQDYPIILKCPGVIKIEQIDIVNIDSNTFYLLIMEESLYNFNILNNILHKKDGYNFLKISNQPFNEIMGDNLLRYFVKQLINLLEFIDRNNLYFEDLSLNKFFVTKKEFLLRLYNFKNIINLDDKEKGKKKANKNTSFSKNKNIEKSDEFELERKEHYFEIGKCIYDLIFGNSFYSKEDECSDLYENKKDELLMKYIKKIKERNIDENLKELLIKLIDFDPKNRPDIEEIYRNKWIHQDNDIINDIISNFEKDIIKIISEFAKYDYFKKLKSLKKNRNKSKYDNNIILDKKPEKKNKFIKTGRFTYKKKVKKI